MKKALLAGVAFTAMGLFNAAQAADANLPTKVPACRGARTPGRKDAGARPPTSDAAVRFAACRASWVLPT